MNNVSEPLEPNALVKFQDPEIQVKNCGFFFRLKRPHCISQFKMLIFSFFETFLSFKVSFRCLLLTKHFTLDGKFG